MTHIAPTPAPPRRILRQPAVVARVGVAATTIWRWEIAGTFPRRVQLGKNSIGWWEHEVEAWLAARERPSETGVGRPSPNPRARRRAVETGR